MTSKPSMPWPDDTTLLRELFAAVYDGSADEDQLQEFEALLRHDPRAADYYSALMQLHVLLEEQFTADVPDGVNVAPIESRNDPIVFFPTPVPDPVGSGAPTFHNFFSGWPAAYLIATVICGIGLTIAAFTYVSQPTDIAQHSNDSNPQSLIPNPSPKATIVARITGTADCRWEKKVASGEWLVASEGLGTRGSGLVTRKSPNPSLTTNHYPLTTNHLVALGDQLILSAGLMEITYNTGAKVILQGPCTFDVDSPDSGFLSIGKLTARVEQSTKYGIRSTEKVASGKWLVASESRNPEIPKSRNPLLSTNHYPLFAIKTPTAVITDLGTEFGVEVSANGDTASHVFHGMVSVQIVGSDGKAQGKAQLLHENKSVRLEKREGGQTVPAVPSTSSAAFVRELPRPSIKTLDLVDVVAGGDGFSGRRNRGIDPTSGKSTDTPPNEFNINGDGKYHRVPELPFVDGVFIPQPYIEPPQVDSSGHIFKDFKITMHSQAMTYGYVWAGGTIPTGWPRPVCTELRGIDYASSGHGVLFLHANKGITFDLDAIRRANPNYKPVKFLAIVGNTETHTRLDGWDAFADVWVLIDGQVHFSRREINGYSGGFPVVVPLDDKNRFLTLVSTDSGNEIHADWIMFGDPRLELLENDADRKKNASADEKP